jgi:hypothetical protein
MTKQDALAELSLCGFKLDGEPTMTAYCWAVDIVPASAHHLIDEEIHSVPCFGATKPELWECVADEARAYRGHISECPADCDCRDT